MGKRRWTWVDYVATVLASIVVAALIGWASGASTYLIVVVTGSYTLGRVVGMHDEPSGRGA